MDEAVYGGDSHGFVGEDLIPAAERLVGRDGDAAIFIAPSDQFEEDAGFSLILVGIGDVVEDDQVEPDRIYRRRLSYYSAAILAA